MKLPTFRPIQSVALYCRVSTKEQAKGHSIDDQAARLSEWAEAEGWAVHEVYADPGATATSVERRPAFLRMIADAEAGQFDAVLVRERNRYARNRGDAAIYQRRLEAAGVQLLSYSEPTAGLSRSAALLTTGMHDLLAEHYSVELSDKTARGWERRVKKGLTLGDVPFGYTRNDAMEPIRPCPPEDAAVLGLYERYADADADVSMADLAAQLNAQGLRPRSKRGKRRFSKASVERILRNPVYAGHVTYHDAILRDGLHAAIVPQALFDRVQRVIDQRARRPRSYARRQPYPYFLSGIGVCAACGGPLWGMPGSHQGTRYYRCAANRRGEECVAQGIGVRAITIDDALGGLLAQITLPEAWQAAVRDVWSTPVPVSDEERAHWQEQARRASEGYKLGLLDEADAVAMKAQAEAALAAMPPTDLDPVLEAGELWTDLRTAWPGMTAEERRDAIRITLEGVCADTRAATIIAVAPRPEFQPLFQAIDLAGGSVTGWVWRPRADSNRRSPP